MSKLGAGRGTLRFGMFKHDEMDWHFSRTLLAMAEGGAAMGECLYAARQIRDGDAESWVQAWSALGERVFTQGDESLRQGALVSARESFLRATTYFRSAEFFCMPKDPRFEMYWQKSRDAFHRACGLFDPPIQILNIPYRGSVLPGYFWRTDSSSTPRPTFIFVGGNDDSGEEGFFWAGPAAVRRGYNFYMIEYPGHRGAVHLNRAFVKQADYEVPFKVILDHLETLPGVDDRWALAGHSHGGYTVIRVAIHDPRIKAVIPSSPLINADRAGSAMFSPWIKRIPPQLLNTLARWRLGRDSIIKTFVAYTFHTLGYDYDTMDFSLLATRQPGFTVEGQEKHLKCAALGLVGTGEGDELLRQAQQFYDRIGSTHKHLKVFTPQEDGSDDHCQLDNRARANQVIFDWLDQTFNYHYPSP